MNKAFNKIFTLFTAVALFSVCLLNGCCDSKASTKGNKEKEVIEFWNTMQGREAAIMPEILKAFHKQNPDIQVNERVVDFYNAKEMFISSMNEGNGPDLMRADRFWLADFVKRGFLEEFPEKEIEEELADMVPVARDFVTFDKKVYAMPISVDSLALFYNKAHLREKSLRVPTNFDEFSNACSKLTNQANNQYGFFIYPNGWYFEPFFFGFGGQYFDNDGKLYIKSSAGKKAFEFLVHLKSDLKVVPPMKLDRSVYNTMIGSFASGQTSMIFTGPWAIRDVIEGSAFRDNNSNLGIEQIPAGPRGTFSPIGCQSIVISSRTKQKTASLKFAKFMFGIESQKNLSMANYGLPARRKVFAAPELKKDPYLQTFIKQLQMSCKAYTHPQQGDIYAPLGDKMVQVLNGDLTIDYALSDIETEWNNNHQN